MVPTPFTGFGKPNIVRTCAALKSSGSPVPAVILPLMVLTAISFNMGFVTELLAKSTVAMVASVMSVEVTVPSAISMEATVPSVISAETTPP